LILLDIITQKDPTMNFNQQLEKILSQNAKFCDNNNTLLKQNIKSSALNFDEDLIELLLNDEKTKEHFFKDIKGVTLFDYRKFIDFIDDKNFLQDSYTKFSNKIGLTISNKHIKQIDDVVLSFPFKDCLLEGGQTKDDQKRKEIFFNETLAKDEINRLLDKKVIANATRYYYEDEELKESQDIKFTKDSNGVIKDNLIIKGNNLLALHTLKSNFAGKVKLIYIDPPYNTGNDSFGYNDNFNHSTWLTFMKNRLEIARELLSDDGVIFITLDDNEIAYLKVLMDELFGRENFIADVIWNSRKSVQNDTIISLATNHNLFYARKKAILDKNDFRLAVDESKYKYDDNDGRGKYKADPFDAPNIRLNLTYPIVNINTQEEFMPPKGRCWRTGKKEYQEFLKDNRIIFGQTGKSKPQLKKYLNEEKNKGSVTTTLWSDLDTTTNATKHLEKIFGKKIFDTPKPENLIARIIELSTKPNDIVLDFHLGSGTTCAVAHKMNRQYIGIEQMDYIENVTVERMKKVVEGEQGGISKAVNWQGGGEFIYFELDKYNQKFIDDLSMANDENIMDIYEDIGKRGFLNYDVELKEIDRHLEEFRALSLEDKKEFLVSILNKNMLYKNLSEIDDEDLGIDETTKALNEDFYSHSPKV